MGARALQVLRERVEPRAGGVAGARRSIKLIPAATLATLAIPWPRSQEVEGSKAATAEDIVVATSHASMTADDLIEGRGVPTVVDGV